MIKRIPIQKVTVGMFVSKDTPGLTKAGLNAEGIIKRKSTLTKIRSSGVAEVYIDINLGLDSAFSMPVLSQPFEVHPTVSIEEEKAKAESIYSDATDLVGSLMHDVKLGNAIDIGPVDDLADEINNSILRNPNALLCLAQIQDKDMYLLEHSINVGILVGVFSKYLGFDTRTIHHMVTGGLLHDIGKIQVPDAVLHKPGKLTDVEWVAMRKHVEYGMATLRKSKGIHPIALEICGTHHEKLDGTGYPNGISGDQISIYGRVASIADIYDAVTASRVYHQGRNPFKAMQLLHGMAGAHLDKQLVYSFIRCMSVYPVGTLIELSDNTLAVVVTARISMPEKPLCTVMFNLKHKKRLSPSSIDLNAPNNRLKIVGIHEPRTLGIDINAYL